MHALTASELFRVTWPRHTAKEAARAARGSIGTAKAWVTARFTPSADTLLRMAQENRELRVELVRLLGEWNADMDQAGGRSVAAPECHRGGEAGRSHGPTVEANASRVTRGRGK